MKRFTSVVVSASLLALVVASASAKKGPPPVEESAANNLSFPAIFAENVAPEAVVEDAVWTSAEVTDPSLECIDEAGVTAGTQVPSNIQCYYGRHVSVDSTTGELVFDGEAKTWWLQQRPANFWKALGVGYQGATPLVVSAVDIGDLLESSPQMQSRRIRTEFNLLQHVDPLDPDLGQYVVADWGEPVPLECTVPTAEAPSLGCFAALAMSGAVPGTEQSGNEIQGTDFFGTGALLDPTSVKLTTPDVGGIHAVVYSRCARLVIQKITGTPQWDPNSGAWSGSAPVVNIAAYSGGYSVEINSGGGIVYGYNWDAKNAPVGTYRLTFVLDGNDLQGPQCPVATAELVSGQTQLVNVGENNPSSILYAGDPALGDEGGLVYVDVKLTTKGGGGRR